jgi:hypothetical protein
VWTKGIKICKIRFHSLPDKTMAKNTRNKKPKYYLNPNGEFVIENYNLAKPFANFFPGIAGKYGIPMWVFYVNRAQAISSFGTKDKDYSILEFFPANKSWQLVSSYGFRTFIKLTRDAKTVFYEPFQNSYQESGFNVTNRLYVSSYGLTLEEDNLTLGLRVKVEYFNIPNDSYAGLARIVTITNLGRRAKSIQVLDGLPQIVPFGTSNLFLKKLGRTIEAWMHVENLTNRVPFYKLDVDPTDRPEVIHIKGGNFYLGFLYEEGKVRIIKPIVDPQNIFGISANFCSPREFLASKNFTSPHKEITNSKMPCGFFLFNFKLAPGEEKVFYAVIGSMRSLELLNSSLKKITRRGYLAKKRQENKQVIEELQQDITTSSSSKVFDLYAKQTYLDNILRGGYPVKFGSDSVFYIYCRKHGDLERDYNKFQLQPAYLSQGNGNYRDMNQNRRCDVWFHPDINEENLIYFFNLLQSDGFNPLVVKGASFTLKGGTDLKFLLSGLLEEKYILRISPFLNKPFTPGELILFIEESKIKLNATYDEFLNLIMPSSVKTQEAEHGEGFWTDHWTYNLDLLEAYSGIYPEKYKQIFFDKKEFTFYDNTEVVRPRAEKYVLKAGLVRQLHAVTPDSAKREMIRKRTYQAHQVRTQYGTGEIYYTTLINKLLCLFVNKLASLDPFGCGIEMEADKPNWFDALNGLPALFGSSICETFELKRLTFLLRDTLKNSNLDKIYITEEIYVFMAGLNNLIKEYFNHNSPEKDYQFWDKSYALKEDYRHQTRFGFSGKELDLRVSELKVVLDNALQKINQGIDRALDAKTNIYYSYFLNGVKEYEIIKEHFVRPVKFTQKRLPLFLEGQMHALRLSQNLNQAKQLYGAVKRSQLYDNKLKMYKVTAPLQSMPEEIGRCRVFTPGWLENESIWLHMEYKYLLETLKQGLYKEFYQDFKNALIPFQKAESYGRSILENSSFLVSSAFPDKDMHGNGFVARLSGSTAEFLQIWLLMNCGSKPFLLNERGELNLRFEPVLAGWLFDLKGRYGFNFLSKVRIVYHNPKRKDTFGINAVKIIKITFNDKDENPVSLTQNTIPYPFSEQIRSRQISQIDLYLD